MRSPLTWLGVSFTVHISAESNDLWECERVCVNQDTNLSEYESVEQQKHPPHTSQDRESLQQWSLCFLHTLTTDHITALSIYGHSTLIFTGCVCLCVFNKGLSWEWWAIEEETLSRKGLKEIVKWKLCTISASCCSIIQKETRSCCSFPYLQWQMTKNTDDQKHRWPKTQSGRFVVNNLWI